MLVGVGVSLAWGTSLQTHTHTDNNSCISTTRNQASQSDLERLLFMYLSPCRKILVFEKKFVQTHRVCMEGMPVLAQSAIKKPCVFFVLFFYWPAFCAYLCDLFSLEVFLFLTGKYINKNGNFCALQALQNKHHRVFFCSFFLKIAVQALECIFLCTISKSGCFKPSQPCRGILVPDFERQL